MNAMRISSGNDLVPGGVDARHVGGRAAVTGADDALKPWSANTHPTDVARSHVEEITAGLHKYRVVQGGTMDGRNCRSPMGCGIAAKGPSSKPGSPTARYGWRTWAQIDVVNPWLSNGRNNFRNVAEIVSSAVTPDMTDAEKAFALWFQEIRYRHHSAGDNNELGDPVKVFNVYGYNTCGNDSICLATLWRKAGLKAAPARALGHCISQAFFDNGWHFYDGDMHCVYLLRDNQPWPVSRTSCATMTWSSGRTPRESSSRTRGGTGREFAHVLLRGPGGGGPSRQSRHHHEHALAPGEAIVWRWGQLDPVKYHGALMTMPTYPSVIYNGLWEYRPDFSRNAPRERLAWRTLPPAMTAWPLRTARGARSSGPSVVLTKRAHSITAWFTLKGNNAYIL